jgi:hypothetical protein
MNTVTTSEKPLKSAAGTKPQPPKTKGLLQLRHGHHEARRFAAAILEVLGGARSPTEAAAALSISLPRYYLWETRALAGLLQACEPRPMGRVRSPASELAAAHKQIEKLQRECARQQALVRAAQRTVGLLPPVPAKPGTQGKKRKRKPSVRALRVAEVLQSGATGEAEAVSAGEQPAKE